MENKASIEPTTGVKQANSRGVTKAVLLAFSIDEQMWLAALEKLSKRGLISGKVSKYAVGQALIRDYIGAPPYKPKTRFGMENNITPKEVLEDFLDYLKKPRAVYPGQNLYMVYIPGSRHKSYRALLEPIFNEWVKVSGPAFEANGCKRIFFSDFFKSLRKMLGGHYSEINSFETLRMDVGGGFTHEEIAKAA